MKLTSTLQAVWWLFAIYSKGLGNGGVGGGEGMGAA